MMKQWEFNVFFSIKFFIIEQPLQLVSYGYEACLLSANRRTASNALQIIRGCNVVSWKRMYCTQKVQRVYSFLQITMYQNASNFQDKVETWPLLSSEMFTPDNCSFTLSTSWEASFSERSGRLFRLCKNSTFIPISSVCITCTERSQCIPQMPIGNQMPCEGLCVYASEIGFKKNYQQEEKLFPWGWELYQKLRKQDFCQFICLSSKTT